MKIFTFILLFSFPAFGAGEKRKTTSTCAYWLQLFDEIAQLEEMRLHTDNPYHKFILKTEIRSRIIEGADGRGERP